MFDEVSYLAHTIKESEIPSAKELNMLQHLKVQLRHTVPPQHEIEKRAGSRPLFPEEAEQFRKIIPIKRGVFSPDEDEKIVHNWKAFCEVHNWNRKNVKPFLFLRHDNMTFIRSKKQRRKFVQFLADGLPNRTLFSVYQRFRTLYQKNKQQRYSREEDKMIIDHIENNPNLNQKQKYSDLAKVLRRTRGSVYKRYILLREKRQKQEEL